MRDTEPLAVPGCEGACLVPRSESSYDVWDVGARLGSVWEEAPGVWRCEAHLDFRVTARTYLSRFDAAQGLIVDGGSEAGMSSRAAAARKRREEERSL